MNPGKAVAIYSTDQLGRQVFLNKIPQRIVSLVPSQTELLFDLGAGNRVAGVTHFCIHPTEALATKTRIGGTKNFKPDVIRKINPDLILANKEENDRELLEKLMNEFPVWVSDVNDISAALAMILETGRLIGEENRADTLVSEIKSGFAALTSYPVRPRCLYLIWRKPWMSIGHSTFIHSMMEAGGLENECATMDRYPILTDEHIRELNPEVVLLSSEPYPFKERHIPEIAAVLPKARIHCVDGEMFSWYGSRMKMATAYFETVRKEVDLSS
jgi:ABC-type Fe3+-hydroxamate transport system substrate-binding protein